ncbi:hypothetical protein TNIN_414481 [Trichonephila inaurata madagascariensis]|uniref:Uncharacterized protein n=1 Tax=Trichonephila inaurata madagascariensis TaxID=2747483 RepID=A0A8X6J555_9ARAC|nr:hypothetical protein TNIN_414481 [Trichonephila inaurata madagascariensis]
MEDAFQNVVELPPIPCSEEPQGCPPQHLCCPPQNLKQKKESWQQSLKLSMKASKCLGAGGRKQGNDNFASLIASSLIVCPAQRSREQYALSWFHDIWHQRKASSATMTNSKLDPILESGCFRDIHVTICNSLPQFRFPHTPPSATSLGANINK